MLAMTQWALAYTLEITSTSLAAKLVWAKFQYLGLTILPVAWLIFIQEFTGQESRITRRNVLLLALIPTTTFLLAVSNELHGWIWRQTGLILTPDSFPALKVEYGFWFWVHTAFSYGCLLWASADLVRSWRRQVAGLYRWQYVALLFGLLLPWAGNALYISGLSPQDLTTFSFLISGVALVHYTLRFRLFDIAPVAHRAVVNSLADAIMVLDCQHRIADVNPAVEQIVGRPATEIIGNTLDALWPNLLAGSLEAQKEPFEVKLGSAESPHYYEITVSRLQDWRRKLRGHLLVFHDINHQKELEQMREGMTHTMVHDLRDPLSNSLFALELLKGDLSGFDSPESMQLLDLTFAHTLKTLRLVDKILDISRLKNGIEMVITRTTMSLSGLIEKVLAAQEPQALSKGLQLTYDVPETVPPAWADAGLIGRVLQNLVDNSIKFSPSGGTIRIAVKLGESNGSGPTASTRLLVSVSDEGPGIPAEIRERVFDRFVAGPNKESGSGLGLAFCRMALMAHGERIWVESEPGRGARFTFSLPVSFEPTPAVEPA
jgi:PAS domain S-box-containing protein